jgi:hypothetical protein
MTQDTCLFWCQGKGYAFAGVSASMCLLCIRPSKLTIQVPAHVETPDRPLQQPPVLPDVRATPTKSAVDPTLLPFSPPRSPLVSPTHTPPRIPPATWDVGSIPLLDSCLLHLSPTAL